MKKNKRVDLFKEMEKEQINDSINENNNEIDEDFYVDDNVKNNNISILKIISVILSSILLILSIINLYNNIKKDNEINLYYLIINNSIILFCSFILFLTTLFKRKLEQIFKILLCLSFITLITFNILVDNKKIVLKTQELMPNLVGLNYQDIQVWAKDNNITLTTQYEYSDTFKEYEIISQDISTTTLLKKVDNLNLIISSGPNYDKTVIIPNMIGWNIDDALDEINKNYLNNVDIQYIKNDDYDKDTIIEQNIKGQLKRNDKLILNVSIGNITDSIAMIDIKDKTLFDINLWLKRNGINYVEEYQYSTVPRGNIISINKKKDETININNDKLVILISKGEKIIVPNILSMSIDDVNNWVIDNNLKISYEDKYDDNIKIGGIISCNYKEDDEIEEGTLINIVTSKGPLKMETFKSLNEFRTWADKYKINYYEEYQYNDSITKGNIIKFSKNNGEIIKNNETITIYISNGKAITIPDFKGKSKTEASNLCKNLGLNCSFVYGNYSSTGKDIITNQNKSIGNKVVSGTYITLTLSKGPAKECNVYIQPTWYGNSADATINSLKKNLVNEIKNKGCNDVTINYKKKCYNTGNSGMIAPDSIKGNTTFKEGNTYTIYIIDMDAC